MQTIKECRTRNKTAKAYTVSNYARKRRFLKKRSYLKKIVYALRFILRGICAPKSSGLCGLVGPAVNTSV